MTPLVLPTGPVFVVAQNPDKENLGCGALIARRPYEGITLQVVFVTAGGASNPNLPTWARTGLGAGDAPGRFLRLPDAAMLAPGAPAWMAAVAELTDVLTDDHPRPGETDCVVLAVPVERKSAAVQTHRSKLGLLVCDGPRGFALSPATFLRLTGPEERCWRPCPVG